MEHVTRRNYESSIISKTHIMPDSLAHHRTIDFINYTKQQIVILDRQNIPIIIPPAVAGTNFSNPHVEVRTTYKFFGIENIRVLRTNIEYFNTIVRGLGDDRKHVYNTVSSSEYDVISGHLVINIKRVIPEEDIKASGSLFDEGTGFLFTVNNKHFNTLNPESTEGRAISDHSDYVKSRVNGILIEIVDNEKLIRERFTFACNKVLKIPTIIDPTRLSGVWVSEVKDTGHSVSEIDTTRYTLEEAGVKFGLYSTIEEAQTSGNPELISKNSFQENQRTIEALKQETEKLKLQVSIEDIDRKKIFQALETDLKQKVLILENEARDKTAEMLRMKEELEKRKLARDDYYDSRSADRKDTSEMVKFIPAVLLGFIGAAVLFRK